MSVWPPDLGTRNILWIFQSTGYSPSSRLSPNKFVKDSTNKSAHC